MIRNSVAGGAIAVTSVAGFALFGCGVTVTSMFPEAVPGDVGVPVAPNADAGDPDAAGVVDATSDRDGSAAGDGPGGEDTRPVAPPDAAVPGVQVGGTWVPKNRAIVLLHIGHSNMAGRGATPAALKPYFYDTHPQLWSYRPMDPIASTGPIGFRPAAEPLSPDVSTRGQAGPGMALLRSALAAAPDAYIISIGCGVSGAEYGLCESFVKGGLFYENTMKAARMLKGKVTFGGVFTMLGANEYWVRDTSKLSDCLRQIAVDIRADLAEPDLPIMYGDYEMTAFGPYLPSLAGPASVIAQLAMMPTKVNRAALIPTTGLSLEDDHHFTMAGHKDWAGRAIQILRDNHWAPWAKP